MPRLPLCLGLLAASLAAPLPLPAQATSIFRFETDEFWLNLHHFLYVLGRSNRGERDAARRAVADAPRDEARGLATLSADDQRRWREAVAFYSGGPSQRDLIFNTALARVTGALGGADAQGSLAGVVVDSALRAALEAAAPAYRAAWWDAHRAANRLRRDSMLPLIAAHGPAILDRLSRAYGMAWPAEGFPIHYSAYTNWAGAYSTRGNLLAVASLDPAQAGTLGLETLFHEAMHQWDREVSDLLDARARAIGVTLPQGLSHAMIFFTAGHATRAVVSGHVPYAEAEGVWERGWGPLREALEAAWLPWLEGRGSRDEALEALIRRATSR